MAEETRKPLWDYPQIVTVAEYENGATPKRFHLTPAELQVLPYLSTHLTIEEIGERLGRSRSTVKTHVASIYEKLGVGKRSDAVNRARKLGLLADSESSSR